MGEYVVGGIKGHDDVQVEAVVHDGIHLETEEIYCLVEIEGIEDEFDDRILLVEFEANYASVVIGPQRKAV